MIQTRHLHGFPWARDGTVCDGLWTREGGSVGQCGQCYSCLNWWFPEIGVPKNGWFIMENPIQMDDFRGTPISGTPQVISLIFYPCPRWGINRSRTTLARFPSRGSTCKTNDLELCSATKANHHHPTPIHPKLAAHAFSNVQCRDQLKAGPSFALKCPQKWLCYDSTCNFGGSPCVGFFSCQILNPRKVHCKIQSWNMLTDVETMCCGAVICISCSSDSAVCLDSHVWPRHGEFHCCPSRSGMHLNGMQNWHLESLFDTFWSFANLLPSFANLCSLP